MNTNTMKQTLCKSLLLLIILFFCTTGKGQTPSSTTFEILKNIDIYSNLIKELNKNYVDEINPGELTKISIDAMLEDLDPYTNFIPESEIEDYRFMSTGEYGGVGALIHKKGKYVVISEVYEGFPAHRNGLKPGDKILEINGESAIGKTNDEVSTALKGSAGSVAIVKVERNGEGTISKEITRENIKLESVPFYTMLNDSTGYIKLTQFTDGASEQVKKAFLKLREKSTLKGLILDLMDNGGGLLNEAVQIDNLFIDKGKQVVSTKGKLPDKNRSYPTLLAPVDNSIPLVILVNGSSASASEIVAGSMQDLDRAVIVGQRTFGKGLVQNVIPLSYNSQVKVTVAKYYIPSGRCIQAVDYSHKDSSGQNGKIPDSLAMAFKTRNGRVVYDKGGIEPDVLIEPRKISDYTIDLLTKYLLFDFVTDFTRQHDSIEPIMTFKVTDDILDSFQAYLNDQQYSYVSGSEKSLEELKRKAEKDGYFAAIQDQYDLLKKAIREDQANDFQRYKDDIRDLLKLEITGRYYYQRGKIEVGLDMSQEIAEALRLLGDRERYRKILSGPGNKVNPN